MTSAKRIKSSKDAGKEKESQTRRSSVKEHSSATHSVRKTTAKKDPVKDTAKKKTLSNSVHSAQSKKKSVSNKTVPPVKKDTQTTRQKKKDKDLTVKTPVKKGMQPPIPSKEQPKKENHIKPLSTKSGGGKTEAKKKNNKKHSSKTDIHFPTTIWGSDSIIGFEATDHLPPPELTSIVGGFIFYGDSVLLANIPGRGWEIIGGRIDLGETPEATFRRETMKQLGVVVTNAIMIGVIRIEHTGPEPPNCPYPFPIGYGVQYIGIAEELLPFSGNEESLGRSLVSFEGFKEHYYDWNEYYEAVFNYACSVYKKWRKKMKD